SKSRTAKRRAREPVGEFRLRQGYGGHRRSFSGGVPRGEALVPPSRCKALGEARRRKGRRERAQRREPRERSEPAKRLARERVGESEGRSPSEVMMINCGVQ